MPEARAPEPGGFAHTHTFAFHVERARGNRWRLGILAAAMGAIAVAELVGGLLSGSLALLADAAHAATDSLALILALLATHLVTRAAHRGKTFGYHRAEILAAFANAVILAALALFIVVEAAQRLLSPRAVDGLLISMFAGAILVVELIGMAVLRRVQGESLNVRSAFLHLAGDAASTIGVLCVGLVVHFGGPGFVWLDPVVSALIATLLSYWAFRLIRETSHILMEGTPGEIDPDAVRSAIIALPGVRDVHDLHLWTLTSGLHTMSAHVVADHDDPHPDVALAVRADLESRFGLGHVTIQLEDPRRPCAGAHA